MQRVLYAERRLPHYRTGLVEQTRVWVEAHGVAFHFIHGQASAAELSKRDGGEVAWAQRMPVTRYAWGGKVVWQPFDTRGYDLVIVSQENGLLFNHWLCRPWRPFRLGFFGHGANLGAADRDSWRERFKRHTTRQADWWFAYTSVSERLVVQAGFPADRITVLNNATDSLALRAEIAATAPDRVQALRRAHGLTAGQTALFMGSLYPGKGLELLLKAAAQVYRTEPGFRLLVAGDGPARGVAEAAARGLPCVRWLGAQRGVEKATLLAACDFMLLPGAVGLAIVDAFAAGLPLLATRAPGHGPEIAYLEPGRNGDLTAPDPAAYAAAVTRLLQQPEVLQQWRRQARADGQRYTLEGMVERFGQGILAALGRPRL